MIVDRALLGSGFIVERGIIPPSILESFTVKSKFEDGVEIPLWEYVAGGLVKLPRYFDKVSAVEMLDIMAEGGSLSFNIRTEHREGQKEVIEQVIASRDKGATGFLVVAPTGVGKTRISIEIIQRLGRNALVVVPKSDLVHQWRKEVLTHTDIPEDQIGIGEGGVIDWTGKKLCIVLADTLAKDREGNGFKTMFGTVVFDEVDRRIPAKMLNSVLGLMPAKYRVAITATPKRRDGLDALVRYHVAECNVSSTAGKKIPASIYLYHYKSPQMIHDPTHLGAIQRRAIFLKHMMKDQARSNLIAKVTSKLVNSGRRTAVVSDRISQLQCIYDFLVKSHGVPEEDIGYYVKSGTTEDERKRAITTCKVVLATYGLFGAGTDVPDLSGLVLASPMVSSTQVVGRVERYHPDKPNPIVVDIIDSNSSLALGWAKARQNEYRFRRLEIKNANR